MAERPDPDARMAQERVGRCIGGVWTLVRVLGVGGMAAVYEGKSVFGDRAALKVLHPEMSRRAELRQRFAQEGSAAARVDHPGVVKVLGSGEDPDGTAYLILELLEGEALGALLRRDGPPPLARLLEILDQVLDVLAVAHASGIVHRDLKPDNLFVLPDGRIKVLDFGIARVLEDVPGAYKTRTGVTLGTVPFMSPEQALGKRAQVDGRSDLFSLGAMTFRLVANRNVHEAETDAEMLVAMASKPAPPLAMVAPRAPKGLAAIVDVALAFSKDSRYPDASTMQADVRALAAGGDPPYATRLRRARDMATRTDLAPRPAARATDADGAPGGSQAPEANQSPPMPVPVRERLGDVPPSPGTPVLQAAHAASVERAAPAELGPSSAALTVRGEPSAEPTNPSPSPSPLASSSPSSDLWPEPLSERSPVSAAPSSRRVMAMPVVPDPAHTAPTVENPAYVVRTEKMPLTPELRDGPTMVSTAPPAVASPQPGAGAAASPAASRAALWIAGVVVSAAGAYALTRSTEDVETSGPARSDAVTAPGPAAVAPLAHPAMTKPDAGARSRR